MLALRPAVLLWTLAAATAAAQETRPPEDDLFGAPAATGPTGTGAADAAPERPPQMTGEKEHVDPLSIGGILYLRSFVAVSEGQAPADYALSLPAIVDGYLDARPNDRVRGFVLGRMFFDPAASASPLASIGSGTGTTGEGAPTTSSSPRMVLDQLWVKFDVEHTVFVTAGRQHVKWGAAHFWTPTDFLHSVPRNPLSIFDERTGTTMLKLHVPWEATGWNFYGVTAFDLDGPATTLGKVVAAGRAEVVLGAFELGVDVVKKPARKPRVGVDASAGVGPFDVYVESAVTTEESVRYHEGGGGECPVFPLAAGCTKSADPYLKPVVAAGLTWSYKYSDEDSLTIGAEGFYNPLGYDRDLYAGVTALSIATGEPLPPYYGRAYAGLYLMLPKPGSWNDTTITLSSLGNLDDRSFISRLDWMITVGTYVRLEAFVSVHYGQKGGEYRLGGSWTGSYLGQSISYTVPAPVAEAGLALQMAL
jgi:hypothetical protein